MRATEAALEASKREVMWLRAEMARLRPPPGQAQNRGMGLLIGGGLVVMTAAFGASFLLRGKPSPPIVVAPPPLPTVQDLPTEPPKPAEPVPPPTVAAAPTPKPVRTARAEWGAVVAQTQGAGPAAGTACKISAELIGDGASATVRDLEVLCGTRFLYRLSDTFSGMSNTSLDVAEDAGKAAGTQRYTLMMSDEGARSGRAQLSLDTTQRIATVWSTNAPPFRVELRMEPWSREQPGEALIDPENRRKAFGEPILRTGTVTSTDGAAPVPMGAVCTADISPAKSGKANCRIRVRCSGKLLYGDGQSGYNVCESQNGQLARINDGSSTAEDGDPAMEMDLSENAVVLRDDGGGSPWKVAITLARAPR